MLRRSTAAFSDRMGYPFWVSDLDPQLQSVFAGVAPMLHLRKEADSMFRHERIWGAIS
jgi:hypothetical protein